MDIIEALDALFRKEKVQDPPYPMVLHRFLASDRHYAQLALVINRHIWDANMVWEIWRTALPRARSAPYLRYVAPKREPAAEALVARVMEREQVRREEAEAAVEMAAAQGILQSMYYHYGVEQDGAGTAAS